MPAIKGAVFTSGKDELFRRRRPDHAASRCSAASQAEKTKDPEAAQKLFDLVGRMSGLLPQARNLRQAVGVGDQRHLHGRRVRAVARLPRPRRRRFRDKVKMALPEVKVGIFPGAGGTQRVPRLTDQQQERCRC